MAKRNRFTIKETGDGFTHFSLMAKWSRTQDRETVLGYTILRADGSVLYGTTLKTVKLQAGSVTDRFHPLSQYAGKDLETKTAAAVEVETAPAAERKEPPKSDAEIELAEVKAELAKLKPEPSVDSAAPVKVKAKAKAKAKKA